MPIPLVCPACRHSGPTRHLARAGASWRCEGCGATFPHTLAPVVAHPLAPFVQAVGPAHPPPLAALVAMAPWLADDAPESRLLQRLAVATRAHWGDLLESPVAPAWTAFRPFLDLLPAKGDVCELGCGAGRVALELATKGRRVVALDTDPAVLGLGEALRERGEAPAVVRAIGADYREATIRAPALRGRDVTFVLADATNPPLEAESFAAVVALNVLDNVRVPTVLLGQADALLAPGGLLLLATPYQWDSTHTDDGERIGGAPGRAFGGPPEAELRRVLSGDVPGAPWRFELVREEERVPFTLVRDERCRFVYDAHVVLARKRT